MCTYICKLLYIYIYIYSIILSTNILWKEFPSLASFRYEYRSEETVNLNSSRSLEKKQTVLNDKEYGYCILFFFLIFMWILVLVWSHHNSSTTLVYIMKFKWKTFPIGRHTKYLLCYTLQLWKNWTSYSPQAKMFVCFCFWGGSAK